MKARLPALIGLALTLALPAAAQQTKCDGPEDACQAIEQIVSKYAAAENNHDAAAIAAFYTSDGIFVPEGPIVSGRDGIEKLYGGLFKAVDVSNVVINLDQVRVHGNVAWGVGSYSAKQTGSDRTSQMAHGNYGMVCSEDGGAWKIRMVTVNRIESPPGQPAAGTRVRAD